MRQILLALFLVLLVSCSSDNDDQEKGVIEKTTDQVATEMVEHIRKPIDKAQSVKELQEQQNESLKEQVENQ